MKQENKNCINENTFLDASVSNILVANGTKNRAFIEQFNYSSVSFTQKNLGSILGFFVVRDNAKTSENIVNFLTSEVKKKYFSPIQKNAEEKFESTLHRINRVLEELANIGNVEWLGQIDSALCVIDSTTIHFSITGNAYILLLRDNALIEISKDLASKKAAEQPLKTFVDISSGDLCPNDKIIITSQELLDFIPLDELQKNAINFGQENFVQFIKTVLTNECSMATTTIVDIFEKEKPQSLKSSPIKDTPSNAFSATAFEEDLKQIPTASKDGANLETPKNKPSEYTNPRTGHIHIQGSNKPIPKQTFIESTQEKLMELFDDIKESTKTNWHTLSKKIFATKKDTQLASPEDADVFDDTEEFDDIPDTFNNTLPDTNMPEDLPKTKIATTKYFDVILYKIKRFKQNIYSAIKNTIKNINFYYQKIKNYLKTIFTNHQNTAKSSEALPTGPKHSLLPNIRHISQLWHKMNTQVKLTTLGILLFMIIIPLFFAKMSQKSVDVMNINNTNTQHTEKETKNKSDTPINPLQDNISAPAIILTEPSIISTTLLNNKLIGVTKNNIILLTDAKKDKLSLPKNSGDIAFVAPMDDLDLIFILTTKDELYSFSPTTKKFIQQKNIPILNHSKIIELGTYMTYLYTLSKDTITRYARIENGFDSGKKWLKEDISLSETSTMAIDDNIYITSNGKVIKLDKGKKVPFSQDPSIHKISNIYTTQNTKFMWLLDKETNTLFKINKSTGQKVDSYTHPEFNDATSLVISEQKDIAIISTLKNILSFKLEKK